MSYPHTDERGFIIYGALTDSQGAQVKVKESSAAPQDRCWLFTEGGDHRGNKGVIYLSIPEAKDLIKFLQRFVDHKSAPPAPSAPPEPG